MIANATNIWLIIGGSTIVATLIVNLISWVGNKVFNKFGRNKQLCAGVQAQLMSTLMDKHDAYMARGSITALERQVYDKIYTSYHNLGANGLMTRYYEEVMALAIIN